jgi:hypothetical protein
MYDDAAVALGPPWRQVRDQNGFYYRTYTQTATYGASMSVSGTYSRIGVVAYRCPSCGTVAVYAGRTLVHVLRLTSSTRDAGLVSWISPAGPRRHGVVTLRVVSRDRPVVLDAFGLLR